MYRAGKLGFVPSDCSLAVRYIAERGTPLAREKGIEFLLCVDISLPIYVFLACSFCVMVMKMNKRYQRMCELAK
jgi:hypothetical protein